MALLVQGEWPRLPRIVPDDHFKNNTRIANHNKTKDIDLKDPVIVRNATNLRAYTAELQANPNIRVIANKNDFLLAAEDLAWTESSRSLPTRPSRIWSDPRLEVLMNS